MDTAFIDMLDEQTARYVREALADSDTDNEVREQLADVTRQAAEVAQVVEVAACADDALAFTQELSAFLDKAKSKATEARRIEAEIEAKLADVEKAQREIEQLSALMPALAVSVNQAFDKHEEAQHDYNENEFRIATLSTRLSMRRGELTELRRRLAQIKVQEV
jgi:chromosome segregation ATPase